MNCLNLVGRLTKDAELSYMKGSGVPVLKFYVATDRKYQKDKNNKKTDFIPCELIGKFAESIAQYMVKGSLVHNIGEIHIDKYTVGNETRDFTKMHVENVRVLSSPKKDFTPVDNNLPF